MEYRREIDGLRALAVLPVIFFHAGFEAFSGGFVGVDVFFVISGYLITSIILTEKEQGTFSLISFYERRARRILPILFFVMALCLPFAWWLLLPSDLEDFSQSLIAVATFSSNTLFWLETGYWGTENELKPLLHTWSLAVEEQFYVLFPAFLMLMWRFRKRWLVVSILIMAGISFLIAEWGAVHSPTANFFLLPTRFWELTIGAGTAFLFLYRRERVNLWLTHDLIPELCALAGLGLILFAVVFFDDATPFPSRFALLPTIGTALIIVFSSQQTVVGRCLGNRALVGIGLISYSAYLWHQPLLAFARHAFSTQLETHVVTGLILATFVLSYFSWRYVEVPFRRKEQFSQHFIFKFALLGSLFFIALGLVGTINDGFDGRLTASGLSIRDLEEKTKINHGMSQICDSDFIMQEDCRTSDDPEILVWGDSYAMHLVPGIVASNPDVEIIQMTKSACGPFFDVAPVALPKLPVSWAQGCLEFTDKVKRWLRESDVRYVVMSSPFYGYLDDSFTLLHRDGQIKNTELEFVVSEFLETLQIIKSMGKTPVVFSPMPEDNGNHIGRCLIRAAFFGRSMDDCNFEADETARFKTAPVAGFLQKVAEVARVVRLDHFLCQDAECITHIDGEFVYRDFGHLSYEGSAIVGERMKFYDLIVQN